MLLPALTYTAPLFVIALMCAIGHTFTASALQRFAGGTSKIEAPSSHSRRYAALLAGAYLGFSALYLLISGRMAALFAGDIETLAWIELAKGTLFVAGTAALLFFNAQALLRRIASDAARLAFDRHALVSLERRALPGLLASSIAHDFNNVLTVVQSGLEELGGGPRDVIDDMRACVSRGKALASRLAGLAQEKPVDPVDVDVVEIARDSLRLIEKLEPVRSSTVRLVAPTPVRARVHPLLIDEIVTNLVLNAAQETGGGGKIELRVMRQGGEARIEVHDDGSGIAAERREQIFEPFYTTKAEGTGLGLLSVRVCAELHQGCVEVVDSDLGGACFRVRLRQS